MTRNAFLPAMLLVVAALNPGYTRAGALICASRRLPESERLEVVQSALHRIPRRNGPVTVEGACWNRNFARASARTPTVVDSDGVRHWWAAQCERKTWRWKCDPGELIRWLKIDSGTADQHRVLDVKLPNGFSVDRARMLASTVLRLATSPTLPLPACIPGPDDAAAWQKRSATSVLEDSLPEAEIELTQTGGTEISLQLTTSFRFDADDQPVCWAEYIIVT